MIPPGRRKWLVDQLRRLADEEQRKGLEGVAVQFRENARRLDEDSDSAVTPKRRGRPIRRKPGRIHS